MKKITNLMDLERLFGDSSADTFLRIPKPIAESPELTWLEKATWSCLFFHGRMSNNIYPRQDTLAKELGCSRRQIVRALSGLREKGFIDWKTPELPERVRKKNNGKKDKSNQYFLLWHKSLKLYADMSNSCDNMTHDSCDNMAYDSCDNMSHHNEKKKTKILKHTQRPPDQAKNSGPDRQSKKRVCEENSFLNSEEKKKSSEPQKKRPLSEYEQDVIAHALQIARGVKNKSAYKRTLEQMARAGELDTSAYEADLSYSSEYRDRENKAEVYKIWSKTKDDDKYRMLNVHYLLAMPEDEQKYWINTIKDQVELKLTANIKDRLKKQSPLEIIQDHEFYYGSRINRGLQDKELNEWEGYKELYSDLLKIGDKVIKDLIPDAEKLKADDIDKILSDWRAHKNLSAVSQ